MLETVVEPLLTGVYGGDPRSLSAASVLPRFLEYERRYGSLIRAVRGERKQQTSQGGLFLSFRHGMQTLTDALQRAASAALTVAPGEATAMHRDAHGWRVRINNDWRTYSASSSLCRRLSLLSTGDSRRGTWPPSSLGYLTRRPLL